MGFVQVLQIARLLVSQFGSPSMDCLSRLFFNSLLIVRQNAASNCLAGAAFLLYTLSLQSPELLEITDEKVIFQPFHQIRRHPGGPPDPGRFRAGNRLERADRAPWQHRGRAARGLEGEGMEGG